MLENAASNRQNILVAATMAVFVAAASVAVAWLLHPVGWVGLPLAAVLYWAMRRRVRRRLAVLGQDIAPEWTAVLESEVSFYRTLKEDGRRRFEKLVQVFLDEVAITGVGTKVDTQTRVLVAASAVIPIFGFDDFEYGLGEVLIYPDSFNHSYDAESAEDRNILGMVGAKHLSGTMILSKPSLLAGFRNNTDKHNVGTHEFAHLIDAGSGDIDGVPPTADAKTMDPWVQWVGRELKRDGSFDDVDDYAYTNEAEYFAVLSEYFFENPTQLQAKHPRLYDLMRRMYHQDPKKRFGPRKRKRRRKTRRNDPCPCGSGEKFKRCCRPKVVRG